MLKLILFNVSLILCMGLGLHIPPCQAAGNSRQELSTVSRETYVEVLDLIFPRNEGGDNNSKELSLVLRFRPSFGPESQININKYVDGRIEVIEYTVTNSKNISYELDAILRRTGRDDVEFLAKSLPVKRRMVNKPAARFERLVAHYAALRFSPQFDTKVSIDGTKYELWYEATSNKSYFLLSGPNPGKSHYNNRIIDWMNEVLETVK